jgi:hypothetical protein
MALLPLRGWAHVLMHTPGQAAAVTMSMHTPAVASAASGEVPAAHRCHGVAADAAQQVTDFSADQAGGHDSHSSHDRSCAMCALCQGATALVGTWPGVAAPLAHSDSPAFLAPAHAAVWLEGPLRPPRA